MRIRAGVLLLFVALTGCKPPEDSHAKAIIGAVLIDGAGGPPLSNSVVVAVDGRIRDAGRQGEVPVSAETNKVDGSGKYLVPALVDVSAKADAVKFAAPGPATVEEARAAVERAASQKVGVIHVWPANLQPAIVEALLETARAQGLAVAGHPVTEAEAKLLVQDGATFLIGMIRDTEALDPVLVTRLRDLRVVYAAELNRIPAADLERANHNTENLFKAGVPLAVASGGGDAIGECELLVKAGVPPLDVIVAATLNGARALGQSTYRGSIAPGKRADLVMLQANPGEEIANLRKVDRRMVDGEWR